MQDSTTPSKTYNGWTNYETWAVGMFLDGNYTGEHTYREVLDSLGGMLKLADEDAASYNERNTPAKIAPDVLLLHSAADWLKDYVEEATEIEGASLAADLLGAALSEVNWRELAEAKITELHENEES